MSAYLEKGTVKFYNNEKGFGFITLEKPIELFWGGALEEVYFRGKPGFCTPKKGDAIYAWPQTEKGNTFDYILERDLDPYAQIIVSSLEHNYTTRKDEIKFTPDLPEGAYHQVSTEGTGRMGYIENAQTGERFYLIPNYISNANTTLPRGRICHAKVEKTFYKNNEIEFFTINGEKFSYVNWRVEGKLVQFTEAFKKFTAEVDSEIKETLAEKQNQKIKILKGYLKLKRNNERFNALLSNPEEGQKYSFKYTSYLGEEEETFFDSYEEADRAADAHPIKDDYDELIVYIITATEKICRDYDEDWALSSLVQINKEIQELTNFVHA